MAEPRDSQDPARRHERLLAYVREKTNELLGVIGTAPLRPEELDEEHLLELDPIGTVAGAFAQVMEHLKHTNARLHLAYAELAAIFEYASVAIVMVDQDLRIRTSNPAAKRLFCINPTGRQDIPCYQALCGRARPPALGCSALRALKTGRPVRHPRWQREGRAYEVFASPVFDETGQADHVVLIYLDITERVRAHREIAEREERLQDFLDNASDLILSVSPEGRILYVNRTWKKTLSYADADLQHMRIFDALDPGYIEHCRSLLAHPTPAGENRRIEVAFRTKDGRRIEAEGAVNWVWENGRPVATRGIFRDVTALRRAEEERRRRETLESLGVLAGGIAHDFNNVLAGILGQLELAARSLPTDHPARERLATAQEAAVRAQGLTHQLLTFAKGGEPRKQTIDLASLVDETARFALAGSSVAYEFSAPPDLPAVEADPHQLAHVVQNLVLNAAQAMGNRGAIRIALEPAPAPDASGQPGVLVTVADTGKGIPPEVLPRVFDPYFTTKPDGTGLGLTTAYSVVTRHGGRIELDSQPGRGTEVRVWLPAAGASVREAETPETAEPETPQADRPVRVLLMDDEEMILDAAADLLDMEGFEVETARDGDEAVALYREAFDRGRPFDVVILDLTVPGGKGGLETLRSLRDLDPEVRAIASSGYANDPVLARPEAYGFCATAPKPYRLSDLLGAVEAALGANKKGRENSPCPRTEPR
ncbi:MULTISPECIES: PAS domain-containing sensor histidine kinase [Deferrisoma]